MGEISATLPVLRMCALISRHAAVLDGARGTLEAAWGPVALASERFVHDETDYYRSTMGDGLLKQFLAFEALADAAELADWKLATNAWEAELAATKEYPEARPLNLDPGYLTEAKLVLATTKDRNHRIYLRGGIHAEVTLHYQAGQWRAFAWTYPDYQRADYHAFFLRCRELLRRPWREGRHGH